MRSKLLTKIKGNKINIQTPDSRLLSSLVLDFLQQQAFKYSLSVFIPECGDQAQFFSPLELAEYFKLEMPANTSILSYIISTYFSATTKPHFKDSSSQTIETSVISELEHRLTQLDLNFVSKKSEENAGIEEKMLKVQRECEARMKNELKIHIDRIRETEITAMKLEEANKYQQMLQKYKNDNEKFYNRELEALKIKEKKLCDQFKAKETELEHKNFCQRQEYLKDSENCQEKYTEGRRKIEVELEEVNLKKNL